jgi:signal transduction histidine kinase
MPLSILKYRRNALGIRLTLWYSTIFVISSLIVFLVSYLFLSSSLKSNRRAIELKLNQYASRFQARGLPAQKTTVSDAKRASLRRAYFVRVIGPGNETLFLNHPNLWQKFELKPPDRTIEGEWRYFPARRDGDMLEVLSKRLPSGLLLQVGKRIQDREEILEHFGDTIVAVIIPVVIIGIVGGAFLAFRALRPVHHLIHTTQSVVDTGKMDARVPTGKTNDELEELVKLFNRMLDRIEGLIKGMKEALDNVAHDLRTPMARLRGNAEMALQSEVSLDRYQEALADCLEESDRVIKLLDTLTDVSEAETGTMRLEFVKVNIAQLIHEIVDLYDYVAHDKAIDITVACPKDIYTFADRNRVRQVLANLLDNAIKYTPERGRIAIHAYENKGETVILVKDNGVGIPTEEIPKIWDRLHRGDKSRSQRGLGLGLSLVKAVVQAHKGRVEVQSGVGTGSVFTVYLPTAPAMTSVI